MTAIVATRATTNNHIPVFCGEVCSSTGYLRPTNGNLIMLMFLKMMLSKTKQCKPSKRGKKRSYPRSSEVLKSLAKVRGSESGFYFAESFMICT